jgi:hypothetical protein
VPDDALHTAHADVVDVDRRRHGGTGAHRRASRRAQDTEARTIYAIVLDDANTPVTDLEPEEVAVVEDGVEYAAGPR